jgi:glycosyltransferase involved in cell wall biosynthesis
VTTSVGAEGTGVTHGENVLVADTAEDFARSTVDLLEDPERRSALGRAAARFARERYASEATQRALLEFYAGLAPASA